MIEPRVDGIIDPRANCIIPSTDGIKESRGDGMIDQGRCCDRSQGGWYN